MVLADTAANKKQPLKFYINSLRQFLEHVKENDTTVCFLRKPPQFTAIYLIDGGKIALARGKQKSSFKLKFRVRGLYVILVAIVVNSYILFDQLPVCNVEPPLVI
ncbi:MAG: hypothetical protein ABW168_26760 [Sedimenticola sp.]